MLELSVEIVKECLVYEAATGRLFWKARPRSHFASTNAHAVWNSKHAGNLAGSPNVKRRWSTKINGRLYQNHRLAWVLTYGEWPSDQIDHMNGDPEDNRVENLRVVTNTDNQKNRWLSSTNTSGANGVYWHSRDWVWVAQIRRNGRQRQIGQFATREEAQKARKAAEQELGYSERHGEKRG